MRTYKKVFRDKEKLDMLFFLRAEGYSIAELGNAFKVDNSSIIYQLHKYFGEGKNTSGKLVDKVVKRKCPKCGMIFDSEYHLTNPC